VTLEFDSRAVDDDVLEDLLRFILGATPRFLHRAPLAGIRGAHGKVAIVDDAQRCNSRMLARTENME